MEYIKLILKCILSFTVSILTVFLTFWPSMMISEFSFHIYDIALPKIVEYIWLVILALYATYIGHLVQDITNKKIDKLLKIENPAE